MKEMKLFPTFRLPLISMLEMADFKMDSVILLTLISTGMKTHTEVPERTRGDSQHNEQCGGRADF